MVQHFSLRTQQILSLSSTDSLSELNNFSFRMAFSHLWPLKRTKVQKKKQPHKHLLIFSFSTLIYFPKQYNIIQHNTTTQHEKPSYDDLPCPFSRTTPEGRSSKCVSFVSILSLLLVSSAQVACIFCAGCLYLLRRLLFTES